MHYQNIYHDEFNETNLLLWFLVLLSCRGGDPAPHVRPFPGRLRWSPRPTIVRVAARILFFSSFFMSPFPRLPNLDAVALRLAVRSEFDLPLAGFEVYQAGPCCPRSVSPPSSPFQPAMLLGAGIVLWLFRPMYNFFLYYSLHLTMQGLFLLGSKTKGSTPVISFS